MREKLLWVYEGLRNTNGVILRREAAAGSPKDMREYLASTAAYLK